MSYHPYAQPQHGYQQQHQAYHPQYDPPLANQPGPFDSAALGGGQQQSAAYSADGCPHGAQPPAAYVPHYMAVPLGPPQLPAQHQQYQYQQHQASSSSAAQQPLAYRPAAPPQQQQHAGPGPTTASTQQQRPLAPPPPPPPQQQQQPVEKGREGGKKMTVHPVKNGAFLYGCGGRLWVARAAWGEEGCGGLSPVPSSAGRPHRIPQSHHWL